MKAEFTIPGTPVGKGRPRGTVSGEKLIFYTPKKTSEYEEWVCLNYMQQCKGIYFEGALRASITAYFPIPKNTAKKRIPEFLKSYHLKKPDADNVAKGVLDALNGLAYKDDSAVCVLTLVKRYAEEPSVHVVLSSLEEKTG